MTFQKGQSGRDHSTHPNKSDAKLLGRELRSIQDSILKSHGIVKVASNPGGKVINKKFHRPVSTPRDKLKTPTMRLLEILYNKSIEELLLSDTCTRVAKKLKVSKAAVSKWIVKLQLKYTAEHLPDCTDCQEANFDCTMGTCWKLVQFRDTYLVQLKKEEILLRQLEESYVH